MASALREAVELEIDANRKVLLSELFGVVGWALQRFAHDPQWRLEGELGYIAMLHTWTQKLMEHFHIHTHKVAISDHRIKTITGNTVTYSWRDRHEHNSEKLDTIPVAEFIRRFCAHILPERFHKIRYGGWMSAAKRKHTLPAIREAIHADLPAAPEKESLAERILRLTGEDIARCPHCGKGRLRRTDKKLLPIKTRAP